MPLVSFIVPCYNYGRFLPDCLNSILSQEGDLEVILIDDASTDNTPEVVRSYSDPRIRAIRHPVNRGHVFTVNEGFGLARGDFMARIDPDDRYRPHFIAATVEKLIAHPEVGAAYGDVALIDDRGDVTLERNDPLHRGRDSKGNEFVALLERNFICAPTLMARRQAWSAALPIPTGLAFNDWYFNLMIARRFELWYVDRVLAEYRVHASNHHAKIVRDRTDERSIFWLLDRIYGERESSEELERRKQKARNRVYASQYLTLAEKYFGLKMNEDARRCYLAALKYQPRSVLRPGPMRRLAATLLGRSAYERCKALLRSSPR